jgi:hypothetical protein
MIQQRRRHARQNELFAQIATGTRHFEVKVPDSLVAVRAFQHDVRELDTSTCWWPIRSSAEVQY